MYCNGYHNKSTSLEKSESKISFSKQAAAAAIFCVGQCSNDYAARPMERFTDFNETVTVSKL